MAHDTGPGLAPLATGGDHVSVTCSGPGTTPAPSQQIDQMGLMPGQLNFLKGNVFELFTFYKFFAVKS